MQQPKVIYLEFTRPGRPTLRSDRPDCPNCDGTGVDDETCEDCSLCGGEGRVEE